MTRIDSFFFGLKWNSIIESTKQSNEVLNNAGQIKVLSNVLKTNISACFSIGPGFISQLGQIYMDLLNLYRSVGVIVSQNIAEQGKTLFPIFDST